MVLFFFFPGVLKFLGNPSLSWWTISNKTCYSCYVKLFLWLYGDIICLLRFNTWEIRIFILIGLVVWFFLWKKLSLFWHLWFRTNQASRGWAKLTWVQVIFCKTSYLSKAEVKFFLRMWRSSFDICEWDLSKFWKPAFLKHSNLSQV